MDIQPPHPRIGLLLPQYGASTEEAERAAGQCDEAGVDIWLAGQIMAISGSASKSALEPLTLMGAVARATRTSRLGFMALAAPYLPAAYLAKALLTLDNLSGGRLDVGLGAGWREEEFDALGVPFGTFGSRLGALKGAIDALEDQHATPRPLQAPRPPVWVAGRGPRVLRFAAERADWTNFARGLGADEFAEIAGTLADFADEVGRPRPGLSLTGTFLGGEESDVARRLEQRAAARGVSAGAYRDELRAANAFVGTGDEVAEQLAPFVRAGCDAFILWPLDGVTADAAITLGAVRRAIEDPQQHSQERAGR